MAASIPCLNLMEVVVILPLVSKVCIYVSTYIHMYTVMYINNDYCVFISMWMNLYIFEILIIQMSYI